MAALLRRVLERDRSGAPLPLPAVASGVRGSRFATAFGRMLQARSLGLERKTYALVSDCSMS